jgi:hypothetical protein
MRRAYLANAIIGERVCTARALSGMIVMLMEA